MATANRTEKSIDQLNSFLRGELSAVQTYGIALDKLDRMSTARPLLETCQQSHARRVASLQQKITARGGQPAEGSGAWGVFAKLVEGSASILGDKIAISALEEGEDHGLHDYRDDLDKMDADTRSIVTMELLPEQERTHRAISTLKHSLQKS
jgi:demethoxyubiquinone hydroxylase (CLK1/Coq7/Cat5 family)